VVEGLATEYILGGQFINRHEAAILLKEKVVRLSDASVIQIRKDSDPLLTPETRVKTPEGPSTKICVSKFHESAESFGSPRWCTVFLTLSPVPPVSPQNSQEPGNFCGKWHY
jgi:hypothetical protein